jgi:tetratricopeptide (TPR) repeat protein
MKDFVRVGNYQQALTLYSTLRHSETIPSPETTHLAGRAAWGLGDAVSARNYLQKAFQGGLNAAGMDLANLYWQAELLPELERLLDDLEPMLTDHLHHAQVKLLRGLCLMAEHQLSRAAKQLQMALIEAQTAQCPESFSQVIRQNLVAVLRGAGQFREALQFLTQPTTGGFQNDLQILCNRAFLTVMLGQTPDVTFTMQPHHKERLEHPHFLEQVAIIKTLAALNNGQVKTATDLLAEAVAIHPEPLLEARCLLMGLLTGQGHLEAAVAQLELLMADNPSKPLIAPHIDHRRGQLLLAQNKAEDALRYLNLALATFASREQPQHHARVLLSIARAYLNLGAPNMAADALDVATDAINTLENNIFLRLELLILGNTNDLEIAARPYAKQMFQDLKGLAVKADLLEPRELYFRAFGQPTVLVAGYPVPIKLQKGLEILAYLLLYPESSIENIIDDLFENARDMDAAKSYFHTARYQLMNPFPDIKTPYNKVNRTYSIDSPRLASDIYGFKTWLTEESIEIFEAGLETYSRPILQGLDGAWLDSLRADHQWKIIMRTLRWVQRLYDRGDVARCEALIKKLLNIDPVSDMLNDVLLEIAHQDGNTVMWDQVMEKIKARYTALN